MMRTAHLDATAARATAGQGPGVGLDRVTALLARLPTAPGETKSRVMQARAVLSEVVRDLPDIMLAERLERRLYDAWLRVECARVLGQTELLELQLHAWSELLVEVQALLTSRVLRAA